MLLHSNFMLRLDVKKAWSKTAFFLGAENTTAARGGIGETENEKVFFAEISKPSDVTAFTCHVYFPASSGGRGSLKSGLTVLKTGSLFPAFSSVKIVCAGLSTEFHSNLLIICRSNKLYRF